MPFAAAGALAGVASAGIGLAGSMAQKGAVSGANADAQAALAQSRNDLMPWMTTGGDANTRSADLLGLNGPEAADKAFAGYRTSPGYQFQLDQGLRAVDAGAAAHSMLRSGATLKAEQAFGAGLADSDFGAYYNRLFGLSNQGLDAARAEAGVGRDSAQASIGEGNAQSSIFGETAKGLGNSVNALLTDKKAMNSIFGTPVTGPGTFQIGPGPGMISG